MLLGHFTKGGRKIDSDNYYKGEVRAIRELIKDKDDITIINDVYKYMEHKAYYRGCTVSIVDDIVIVQKVI